jgi:hypothetical protein
MKDRESLVGILAVLAVLAVAAVVAYLARSASSRTRSSSLQGRYETWGAFLGSLLLAIWSANGGTKAIIDAQNVVYEKRVLQVERSLAGV